MELTIHTLMLSREHSSLDIILLRLKAKIQSKIIDLEYSVRYAVHTGPKNQKRRKRCRKTDRGLRVMCSGSHQASLPYSSNFTELSDGMLINNT